MPVETVKDTPQAACGAMPWANRTGEECLDGARRYAILLEGR